VDGVRDWLEEEGKRNKERNDGGDENGRRGGTAREKQVVRICGPTAGNCDEGDGGRDVVTEVLSGDDVLDLEGDVVARLVVGMHRGHLQGHVPNGRGEGGGRGVEVEVIANGGDDDIPAGGRVGGDGDGAQLADGEVGEGDVEAAGNNAHTEAAASITNCRNCEPIAIAGDRFVRDVDGVRAGTEAGVGCGVHRVDVITDRVLHNISDHLEGGKRLGYS